MTFSQTKRVVICDELEPNVTIEMFTSQHAKTITMDINGPFQFVSVVLDIEKVKRAIEELTK